MMSPLRSMLFVLLAGLFLPAQLPAQAPPSNVARSPIEELADRYQLTIITSHPEFPMRTYHGLIEGREADPKYLESYLPIFASEWSLYPVELIRRTRLQRIILCTGLSFAGQARTAIPDFARNDLYIDVARGRHSEQYTRKVIHHEFFHIIDYRDDGSLYADERWSALNPLGFHYGTGGKNAQNDATVSLLDGRLQGFLNRYSMTAVEEDKAELFTHMIVNGRMVEERAKKDKVLQSKVERMKELVRQFCPRMDEQFWEVAERVERSPR